jgi:hypothetical protein
MAKHTHGGDPTYYAYVHLKCRHPECQAAAVEYRDRLRQRRMQGDWRDLRFKDQRRESSATMAEEIAAEREMDDRLAERKRDIAAAADYLSPELPAGTRPSVPPDTGERIQTLARKVYTALQRYVSPVSGEVNERMLGFVSLETGLTADQLTLFIETFLATGMLERKQGNLYAKPASSPFDDLIQQTLGQVQGAVGGRV